MRFIGTSLYEYICQSKLTERYVFSLNDCYTEFLQQLWNESFIRKNDASNDN